MGCELCSRPACIRSFHSIEEQEDHDKTKGDVMNERDALRDEAKMYRERYELEQTRYEGISSANDELRASLSASEAEVGRLVEEIKVLKEGRSGSDSK